ncbi:MAG: ATP-binding cassette domain-containing protein [Bacteroidales bacterium]|nr:ATP-binding cassette domain-containing protein [Bacteroidales bacterium]MBN2817878.1 ATP-binding cassette domain-containing protein [Bacteroidales bacterium]
MKESVLKSLMRLFAIVSQVHSLEQLTVARQVIEDYLKIYVRSTRLRQFLIMFDFYHNNLREREIKTGDKQLSMLSVKSVIICDQVNSSLSQKDKLILLIKLLEVISLTSHIEREDIDFIKTISDALNIEESTFNDCLGFITQKVDLIYTKEKVLVIDSTSGDDKKFKHLYRDFLTGRIYFIYIEESKICLFKNIEADDQLYYNDIRVIPEKIYFFEQGGVLKSPLFGALYYANIIKEFLYDSDFNNIRFVVEKLSYHFPNSDFGIEPFYFREESGQMIGIMGGSGVGKSTLINLLNGNIIPTSGRILINGYNIHKERSEVNGLMGYVPQDDILMEDLTVFQNLYFNAQLCFRELTRDQIVRKVAKTLYEFGLYEIRDLKVGSFLNRYISGGQRKRLNIAIELIREPKILFVDEPTSGLSSTDSEKVMELLKYQSLRGKLVIVNIHQPSSKVYKLFDKIMVMDVGGRMVFQGNPHDTFIYMKTCQELVNSEEGECPTCGNLNPEQILQILESKKVNKFGHIIRERQTSPEEWYSKYWNKSKLENAETLEIKSDLPKTITKTPTRARQFKIYSLRNLLSKLSDKQYLLINIFEAPVLGFLLAWFTKFNAGNDANPEAYIFFKNVNFPVYLFISIVVALFIGLMVSAEEIIRDKKILKREAFLNLSKKTYYHSKIVYVISLLAVQMFLFVLIGNRVLEVKGMLFHFWLLLWVLSVSSAIVGLNLSASLKSVIAIYILIPFILIPQILLGGAMIHFDKLNSKLSSTEYVSVIADIMPSRWAYEALCVYQFKRNDYQKLINDYEMHVSNASFMINYYLPEMGSLLNDVHRMENESGVQKYRLQKKLGLVYGGIDYLQHLVPVCKESLESLDREIYNISTHSVINRYLKCCREFYLSSLEIALNERDKRFNQLEGELGSKNILLDLKMQHSNEKLSDIVLNKLEPVKIEIKNDKIIRKADPIYFYPKSTYGRSHFFAPAKRIGNFYVETYWFNLVVLLIMVGFFYILLVFDILDRVHRVFNSENISRFYSKKIHRVNKILKPGFK